MKLHTITKSLGMMAYMVSEKTGIRVNVKKARTASVNGSTITMPMFPIKSSEDWLKCEGYLYHEAAHIKYTDFSVLMSCNGNLILKEIWNYIEDIWIERALAIPLPGVRFCFEALERMLFQAEEPDAKKVSEGVLNFLYFFLRWKYTLQGDISTPQYQAYSQIRGKLQAQVGTSFVETFESLASQVEQCHATAKAMDIATRIYELVRNQSDKADDETKNEDPPDKGDKPEGPSAPDNNSHNKPHNSDGKAPSPENERSSTTPENETGQPGPSSSEADEKPQTAPSGASKGDGSNDTQLPKGSDEDGSPTPTLPSSHSRGGRNEGASLTSGKASSHANLLSWAQIEEEAQSVITSSGKLREWLEQKASNCSHTEWIPKFPMVLRKYRQVTLSSLDIANASKRLEELRRLVLADTLKRARTGFTGIRVSSRKLAGLATGTDLRVFKSKMPRKALDTYIHLLVDASDSMQGDRMLQANLVFTGLMRTLDTTPGIKVETSAFTTEAGKGPVIYPFSGIKGKGFPTGIMTPLGDALSWVLFATLSQPQKRKIIFVITDGHPDNESYARQVIAKIEGCGIQVIGIVLSSPGVNLFRPSIHIRKASDLASALKSIWKNLLYPEV